MAAGTTPIFIAVPKSWSCRISTANTELVYSSGTLGTLVTGAASGSAIEIIRIKATETTTAGMVRLWLTLDNGTNKRLIAEIPIPAITKSASVAAFEGEYNPTVPIYLPDANAIIYASTEKGEGFTVSAQGGDYA